MTTSTLTLATAAAAGRIVGRCGAEHIVAGRNDGGLLDKLVARELRRNPELGEQQLRSAVASRATYLAAVERAGDVDEFPTCGRCGARDVEDAGDHADSTGHYPTAAH